MYKEYICRCNEFYCLITTKDNRVVRVGTGRPLKHYAGFALEVVLRYMTSKTGNKSTIYCGELNNEQYQRLNNPRSTCSKGNKS